MEIIIGLIIIAIGSFCQSSSYVPIKKVKEWSWERFWLLQGVFAWLVLPVIGCVAPGIPQGSSLFDLWGTGGAPMSIFYGILWGVARSHLRSFHALSGSGLRTKYRTGHLCPDSAHFFPPFLPEPTCLKENGRMLLLGVCITLSGIAIIGYAGSLRAQKHERRRKNAQQ